MVLTCCCSGFSPEHEQQQTRAIVLGGVVVGIGITCMADGVMTIMSLAVRTTPPKIMIACIRIDFLNKRIGTLVTTWFLKAFP